MRFNNTDEVKAWAEKVAAEYLEHARRARRGLTPIFLADAAHKKTRLMAGFVVGGSRASVVGEGSCFVHFFIDVADLLESEFTT